MTNTARKVAIGIALAMIAGCANDLSDAPSEGIELQTGAVTSGVTAINCGAIVGYGSFVADTDFTGGSFTNFTNATPLTDEFASVSNFAPDLVYHTGRSGVSKYILPGFAPGARNVVRLHFIERIKNSMGQRRFNVVINGIQVLTNFDIFVAASGANRPAVREFTMGADLDGKYTINFNAVTDDPMINAIEVVPSTLPQATQIACGQAAIGAFADDVGFSTTGSSHKTRSTAVITPAGVLHVGPTNMYQSQRYGSAFSYTVPGFAPGSTNTVRLHFAETNPNNNGPGIRKFNVKINSVQVLTDFDLFAQVNALNTPIVREFRATARPGTNDYLIELQATADAATISGIEVLPTVSWSMRTAMTGADYQTEFNARIANGYRLTYVDAATVNGTPLFSAIFDLSSGPAFAARHNLSPTDLQTQDDAFKAAGFHIKMLNGYAVGSSELYAAIWEQGSLPSRLQHHSLSQAQWQTDFNTQVAAGLKLVHLSGFESGGTDHYAAIWDTRDNGNVWSNQANLTEAQLTSALAVAGNRVLDLTSYNVAGTQRYAVTLEKSADTKSTTLQRTLSRADFQQRQLDLYRQGFTPILVNAAAPSSGNETYAAFWRNDAYSKADFDLIETTHKSAPVATFPSDSIAITKNGRLVFAKAWGTSDGTTPATTSNLYRQASVSKSITSIGILKLVEQGQLNLHQTVFGPGGLLTQFPGPFGTGVTAITVEQLLVHASGIKDPDNELQVGTFATTTAAITAAIKVAVAPPATGKMIYSNMGYCVLGRVIEKVTGVDYTSWIQANVLAPIGITDMRIGDKLLANRFPNEVVYTPNTTAGAYQWNLNIFDAYGGWIATPTDIARFGVHTTGLPVPSLISPTTLAETNVLLNDTWSVTWDVQKGAQNFKDGDLPPGTQSYIVRHTRAVDDGILWAGVTNVKNSTTDLFHDGHEQIDQPAPNPPKPGLAELAVTWPSTDFFLDPP